MYRKNASRDHEDGYDQVEHYSFIINIAVPLSMAMVLLATVVYGAIAINNHGIVNADLAATQHEAEIKNIRWALGQSLTMDRKGEVGDGFELIRGRFDNAFVLRAKYRPSDEVLAPSSVVLMCERGDADRPFEAKFAERLNGAGYTLRADLNSHALGASTIETIGAEVCATYSQKL